MKEFKVTFNDMDKYSPIERTVSINTDNSYSAKKLAVRQYGKKIKVVKVEEVKKKVVEGGV